MRSIPEAKRFRKTNTNRLMDALLHIREAAEEMSYCKPENMSGDAARENWERAQKSLAEADAAAVRAINALGGPLVIGRSTRVDGSTETES